MKIINLCLLFLLTGCVNHKVNEHLEETFPKSDVQLEVKYAKGFELIYTDSATTLVSKSIEGNENYRDSIVLVHSSDFETPINSKSLRRTLTSINCQSSTHLAFIHFFNKLEIVSGLCGLEYVHEGEIKTELENSGTQEVCLGENIQLEASLSTSPELFFVYPFAKKDMETMDRNGVKTLMISEYLEDHPLARLEWIKIFAVLLGEEEKADLYFSQVEKNYLAVAQSEADTNKRFLFNLPYGDTWYTPSSNSLVVKLLEDAGLSYFYKQEMGTENTPHAQEEVWSNGAIAEYWVIIADRPEGFSLDDLISENEVYKTFKSVKHQQVIFCNSTTTDYFLTGVIEPDVMLKDLLFATHKMDAHQPKYFHLLK